MNFGNLCDSRNWQIPFKLLNFWAYVAHNIFILCNIWEIWSYATSHIPHIENLCLLSFPLLIKLARSLSILQMSSKNQVWFHWFFSIICFYFIDLHFDLYCFPSSSYFCFHLVLFSYFFIRWTLRSIVWYLSFSM